MTAYSNRSIILASAEPQCPPPKIAIRLRFRKSIHTRQSSVWPPSRDTASFGRCLPSFFSRARPFGSIRTTPPVSASTSLTIRSTSSQSRSGFRMKRRLVCPPPQISPEAFPSSPAECRKWKSCGPSSPSEARRAPAFSNSLFSIIPPPIVPYCSPFSVRSIRAARVPGVPLR